jgi:hypothetical protein
VTQCWQRVRYRQFELVAGSDVAYIALHTPIRKMLYSTNPLPWNRAVGPQPVDSVAMEVPTTASISIVTSREQGLRALCWGCRARNNTSEERHGEACCAEVGL